MNPNIPISALPILGADRSVDGQWGLVPWMHAVAHPLTLAGLRGNTVTTFGYTPIPAVLVTTDSDNDLDGPGGSRKVDPCWQGQTSLCDVHNKSCDSRQFPGVVISPRLEQFGVKLGDFCLVSWNGTVRSAQVYDIGPTRKAGENSLYLNRSLGIVPAAWSDHQAAICGHDEQDVCTLIFPGSGPGHAVSVADIIVGARACWKKFTSRELSSAV